MVKTWGWMSFILFCLGVILAIIGGIAFPASVVIAAILVIFGLSIGIIHVSIDKEGKGLVILLLATIAILAMTAAFAPITVLGISTIAASILVNFAALMSPVALIAAIKALLKLFLEPQVKIKTWGWISFILFCLGVILAVVGGIAVPSSVVSAAILVIFGFIIGLIFVSIDKEGKGLVVLLLATIAILAMTAAFAPITVLGISTIAAGILVNFATLMAPVALIASIKALLKLFLEPQVKI